jgi:hypothetical protein
VICMPTWFPHRAGSPASLETMAEYMINEDCFGVVDSGRG